MKKDTIKDNFFDPKKQIKVFGYEKYLQFFINLLNKRKMPSVVLLSGPKGLGKSTFAFHLINYIFSLNEEYKYNLNDFSINKNNSSFKLVNNGIHPNFFLLDSFSTEKEIKIEQARNLIKFLNTSTYLNNKKVVLIDNAELLNISSSNSLLKSIEEPSEETLFLIIHNSSNKIIETIKSRALEFKIFFNFNEKLDIFNNLLHYFENEFISKQILDKFLHFDTPGNVIKYSYEFSRLENNNAFDQISFINLYIDKYKNFKDPESLIFISTLINKFYLDLLLDRPKNINASFYNYSKIKNLLLNLKTFNLSEKYVLGTVQDIIQNETR